MTSYDDVTTEIIATGIVAETMEFSQKFQLERLQVTETDGGGIALEWELSEGHNFVVGQHDLWHFGRFLVETTFPSATKMLTVITPEH